MAGYYGGYMGNEAGMQGTVAGAPGYMPSDKEIQDRLFQYGLQNTPKGLEIQRNIKKLQESLPPGFGLRKAEMLPPGSSNLTAAVGNMGGVANAQFFEGPQLGQVPPGFQNKIVF